MSYLVVSLASKQPDVTTGGAKQGDSGNGDKGATVVFEDRLLVVDPRDPTRRLELKGDYSSVTESPDGKRVATVLQTEQAQKATLMVIDLVDGGASVDLASAPQILDVRSSPDGSKVSYTERQVLDGPSSIHVSSVDGTRKEMVASDAALKEWLPGEGR